jgi:hypothetical protein
MLRIECGAKVLVGQYEASRNAWLRVGYGMQGNPRRIRERRTKEKKKNGSLLRDFDRLDYG